MHYFLEISSVSTKFVFLTGLRPVSSDLLASSLDTLSPPGDFDDSMIFDSAGHQPVLMLYPAHPREGSAMANRRVLESEVRARNHDLSKVVDCKSLSSGASAAAGDAGGADLFGERRAIESTGVSDVFPVPGGPMIRYSFNVWLNKCGLVIMPEPCLRFNHLTI